MSGIFGGGGSPQPVQNQSSTTRTEPPEYALPYLKEIAKAAKTSYDTFLKQGYNQPYQGQRTAGANSYDTMVKNLVTSAATNYQNKNLPQQTYNLSKKFSDRVLSGDFTNILNESGTADQVMAKTQPVMDAFMEQTIPRLKSAAIDAGAYGGSKSSELSSRALRDTQKNVGQIAADINYQDIARRQSLAPMLYNAEQSAANNAIALGDKAFSQSLQTSDIWSNLADRERAFQQAGLSDAMAKWQEQTMAPWAGLGDYAAIVQGAAPGGTSTSAGYGFQPKNQGFVQGLMGVNNAVQGTSYGDSTAGNMLNFASNILPFVMK